MTSRRIFISSFALLAIVTAAAVAMMAGRQLSRHDEGAPAAVDAAPAAAAQEVRVEQRYKQFSQGHMTLKAGDRIKFVNDDTVAHDVFVTGPGDKTRNSGMQDPGDSSTVAFDAPGTYGIECGIHPEMRMTVDVR